MTGSKRSRMKPKILGAVIAVTALGWATGGLPLTTAASSAPIKTVAQVRTADPSNDLAQAQADFEAAQAAEAEAQQRAAQASQAAAEAASTADQAKAKADRAKGEHAAAIQASEDAGADLGRLAAYAYANNGRISQLAELSAALDPADFQSRSASLNEVLRVQDSLMQQAASAKADAVNAATRADAQAAAAVAAAEQATAKSAEAKSALAEATAAATKAEASLNEVRRANTAAEQAAAQREAAGGNPDRGSRDTSPLNAPPPAGDGKFLRPSSGRITSPYGMRVHPVTGVYKLHSGTDFGAACGSPARAAYPGTVESASYAGAYGNRVEVSHGVIGGVQVTTTYNHLSAFAVRPNQTVAAGDLVGRVGTTGSSTGCHLHFEVLVNGEFTNPMGWL